MLPPDGFIIVMSLGGFRSSGKIQRSLADNREAAGPILYGGSRLSFAVRSRGQQAANLTNGNLLEKYADFDRTLLRRLRDLRNIREHGGMFRLASFRSAVCVGSDTISAFLSQLVDPGFVHDVIRSRDSGVLVTVAGVKSRNANHLRGGVAPGSLSMLYNE